MRKLSHAFLLICAIGLPGCVRPLSTPAAVELDNLPNSSAPAGFPPSPLPSSPIPLSPTPLSPTPIPPRPSTSSPSPTVPSSPTPLPIWEAPVQLIPLAGPLGQAGVEISGMAWFSDTLILLPRFPENFENHGGGSLFAIKKTDLLAFLHGSSSDPITPQLIPFFAPGVQERFPGFEGFQAIAFSGDRVYLSLQASSQEKTTSHLVSGWYDDALKAVYLDADRSTAIPPQTQLPGLGGGALVPFGLRLVTINEANGAAEDPSPRAHMFGQDLSPTTELAFPSIEYRLTDATPADESGRFWAVNTYSPRDSALKPPLDPLAEKYGEGRTHSTSPNVERLVEFQFTEQGIVLSETEPIQLELDPEGSRDWAAIARLNDSGFLLATGQDLATLLAFVPAVP